MKVRNYPNELNHALGDATMATLPGKELRCVEAISGNGVEVGDRCKIVDGCYVPIVRWFAEGGKEYPMKPIKIEDTKGFRFI